MSQDAVVRPWETERFAEAMRRTSGTAIRQLPRQLLVHGGATLRAGTWVGGAGRIATSRLATEVHVELMFKDFVTDKEHVALGVVRSWPRVTCDATAWGDCWAPDVPLPTAGAT